MTLVKINSCTRFIVSLMMSIDIISITILDIRVCIKMNKNVITFGDTEIEKQKFHHSKYPINISNVDFDR